MDFFLRMLKVENLNFFHQWWNLHIFMEPFIYAHKYIIHCTQLDWLFISIAFSNQFLMFLIALHQITNPFELTSPYLIVLNQTDTKLNWFSQINYLYLIVINQINDPFELIFWYLIASN